MKTILIVEDSEDILKALEMIISIAGYKPLIARDGKQALKILSELSAKKYPCLIVTDLMMPNMTGHQLLAVLREDDKMAVIPVVVMSATESKYPHIKRFIKKPFNLESIISVIKEFCGEGAKDGECKGEENPGT